MINFCHISPINTLHLIEKKPVHLLLAHLVEENQHYRDFYRNLKMRNPKVFYHLDNSAFEMFKRGEPMYPATKLIHMADLVGADSIVMSDYPKQDYVQTIGAAEYLIPAFKQAGYKTFFCPQSEIGRIDDLIESFEWALNNGKIDYIGVSILACPIALGVDESSHHTSYTKSDSYRMQRYLARRRVFEILDQKGLLDERANKRFHCLGMTDGPNEISLLKEYHHTIFSWDSSSAIWHGMNNIKYDQSPTGLRHGKLELEVDFNYNGPQSFDELTVIKYNMQYIDKLCGEDNNEV